MNLIKLQNPYDYQLKRMTRGTRQTAYAELDTPYKQATVPDNMVRSHIKSLRERTKKLESDFIDTVLCTYYFGRDDEPHDVCEIPDETLTIGDWKQSIRHELVKDLYAKWGIENPEEALTRFEQQILDWAKSYITPENQIPPKKKSAGRF